MSSYIFKGLSFIFSMVAAFFVDAAPEIRGTLLLDQMLPHVEVARMADNIHYYNRPQIKQKQKDLSPLQERAQAMAAG